jgi:hypothetical protein
MVYFICFIYSVLCWCWCLEIEINSVDWSQLSILLSKDRQNPVSETLCFKYKSKMMDNVQKLNSCINVPSSQTFRSYLHNQYGPGIYPRFRKFECVKIQLVKTSSHLTFLLKCKIHDIIP